MRTKLNVDVPGENISCKKCGNDKFIIRESEIRGFAIACDKCGEGFIFGGGMTARDIIDVMIKKENE